MNTFCLIWVRIVCHVYKKMLYPPPPPTLKTKNSKIYMAPDDLNQLYQNKYFDSVQRI